MNTLMLSGTKVTDAGLAHFQESKLLTEARVTATGVTDRSLEWLGECKKLKTLDVRQTKVTEQSLNELKAKLPNCKVEWDGGAKEPKGK